jgi:hypothetical protein
VASELDGVKPENSLLRNRLVSGTDFENIFAKTFCKKLALFVQNTANVSKN